VTSQHPPPKIDTSKRQLRVRRFFLRRGFLIWHRRIGVSAALLVLVLAITGILLNNSVLLNLDGKSVRLGWLLTWYGIAAPELTGYEVNQQWLGVANGTAVYRTHGLIADCNGSVLAAMALDSQTLVICEREILSLSQQLELMERIDASYGLPENLTAAGYCDGELCLQAQSIYHGIDLEQLTWPVITGVHNFAPISYGDLPKAQAAIFVDLFRGQDLTWERVMLDLHSGRLFGSFGYWLMNFSAVAFILLAGSGLWLWLSRERAR